MVVPTWMLSYATEYWQYLVLGLFVGVAGGSFAVGIAYTSAWFSKERQGTAMGIFGAGNAGSSLTKFIAPLIIAASATASWRAVPKVYAVAMLVMAIVFWFTTTQDPLHRKDAQKGRKVPKLSEQLLPLLDVRVWRFGLAYYFVFGAFVALALWLPKYYVGEFGLPLATAAFLTILFDLPSGAIRALGGWASDKWGGNTVTWWVMWISLICMFILSYPPTTMIIHGIKGDVTVGIGVGVVMFTVLIFIVGLAQGFGKASVYRSLADHYPTSMGVVGGIVGVIGGLGGFTLPIMFGVAADVIGVRSSCFMLITLVIIVTMIWMWVGERNERESILAEHADARAALEGADLIEPRRRRRHVLVDWRPDDEAFWTATGRRIATRNLLVSMPALLLAFAVWVVWSVIVVELPRIGFKFTTNQLFWLAALPGISGAVFRALYSFVVPIFGGRNWTVWRRRCCCCRRCGSDSKSRTRHQLRGVRGDRVAVRVWEELLVVDGTHQLPLPRSAEGKALGANAGVETWCRSSAADRAARDVRRRAAVTGGSAQTRELVARWCEWAETPASSGCR